MRNVTATRPNAAPAPTICGSRLRDRGKICIGIGPARLGLGGEALCLARAYTKSGLMKQRRLCRAKFLREAPSVKGAARCAQLGLGEGWGKANLSGWRGG